MTAVLYRVLGFVVWRLVRGYMRGLRRGGLPVRGAAALAGLAVAIAAGALARVRRPR